MVGRRIEEQQMTGWQIAVMILTPLAIIGAVNLVVNFIWFRDI